MNRIAGPSCASRPEVVLLHGWALSGAVWGAFAERLAGQFRVHAPDLPGHGGRPLPDGCDTLAELALEIERAMPPRASVVGWSLGGLVAMWIAAQGTISIDRLVLLDTTPRFVAGSDWPHGIPSAVLSVFAERSESDVASMLREFLALQVRGEAHPGAVLRELRARLAERGLPQVRALRTGLKVLGETDLRTLLHRVRTPTLVVSGSHDRLTPPGAGRYLAQHLPDARFELIEHAGHAPFISHGEVLADLISAFLAPLPAEPA